MLRRTVTTLRAKNVPLQVEHMIPRARGGSSRISNLCLACEPCNTKKGARDIREFLKHKPDLLTRLLSQAKAPLKDAAAVNATSFALYERLQAFGLPVECGSGGLTKYNRTQRGLPKTHWLDAACVGTSTPECMDVRGAVPLLIAATGHGSRQMCRMDRFGFPRTGPKQAKRVKGFQMGATSCGQSCPLGRRWVPTSDALPSGARAPSISPRTTARSRGSAIAIAPSCSEPMATSIPTQR